MEQKANWESKPGYRNGGTVKQSDLSALWLIDSICTKSAGRVWH